MASLTVSAAVSEIGSFIPFDKTADWDVGGLQLGDPASPVTSIAVCHEVTEEVAARVEEGHPSLLLAYHPLLFRPTRSVVAGRSPAGRAHRLIRAGTSLAIAHTAWDMAHGGTADALADAIGITEPSSFGPAASSAQVKVVTFVPEGHVSRLVEAMSRAGGGTIGNYDGCHFTVEGQGGFIAGDGAEPVVGEAGENVVAELRVEMIAPAPLGDAVVAALVDAHPYEEPAFDVYAVEANSGFIGRVGRLVTSVGRLALAVEEALGTAARVSGDGDREVRRVAVVPGSGGGFVPAAAAAGADAIVTGDVGHHTMIEALDRGMAVIDPGHAPTERPGLAALIERVSENFSGRVAVFDYRDLDPTPWR